MKIKTFAFLFFILLTESVIGQVKPWEPVTDPAFIKFRESVSKLERLPLNIEPIKPTDTISLVDINGIAEKYKLRYVEARGNPPSFEEHLKIDNRLLFIDSSYSCTKLGTDFILIQMAKPTGMINDITYYYEIIKKEK